MNEAHPAWLVSILCISENKNYIIASSPKIRDYFTSLLHLTTKNDWLVSDQLYLRKEIIGKMLDQ